MTGSPKCLGYFLECNGDSLGRYWSCKAHANLKVVNHKDPSKSLERSISHLFYFKQNEYGYKVEGKIDKFWDFKLNTYPTNVVGSSSIWTYQILKMYLLLFSPGRCTWKKSKQTSQLSAAMMTWVQAFKEELSWLFTELFILFTNVHLFTYSK